MRHQGLLAILFALKCRNKHTENRYNLIKIHQKSVKSLYLSIKRVNSVYIYELTLLSK